MAFVPIASIISKRAKDRKNQLNKLVNRSPFEVSPRVGLYGYMPDAGEVDGREGTNAANTAATAEGAPSSSSYLSNTPDIAFKCKAFHVEAKVVHTTVKVRVAMHIMLATDEFDFYFPISECGEVSDVHTSIRGINFAPHVVRRGPAEEPKPAAEEEAAKKKETTTDAGMASPSASTTADGAGASVSSGIDPKSPGADTLPPPTPMFSTTSIGGGDASTSEGATVTTTTTTSTSAKKPTLPYNRDTTGLIPSSDLKRFLPDDENKEEKAPAAPAAPAAASSKGSVGKGASKKGKAPKEEPAVYYLHFRKLSTFVRKVQTATQMKRELEKHAKSVAAAGANGSGDASAAKDKTESPAKRAFMSPNTASNNNNSPVNTKPLEVGNIVTVVISYTTKLIEKEPIGSRYHFFFPLSCAPIPPTSMSLDFSMRDNIQRIVSLNESHTIRPYYRGDKAEVLVMNEPVADEGDDANGSGGKSNALGGSDKMGNRVKLQRGQRPPAAKDASANNNKDGTSASSSSFTLTKRDFTIMLEDYVFVLVVELGPVIIPQFADPMTLFILATAFAAFIFASLTRDLDDLF